MAGIRLIFKINNHNGPSYKSFQVSLTNEWERRYGLYSQPTAFGIFDVPENYERADVPADLSIFISGADNMAGTFLTQGKRRDTIYWGLKKFWNATESFESNRDVFIKSRRGFFDTPSVQLADQDYYEVSHIKNKDVLEYKGIFGKVLQENIRFFHTEQGIIDFLRNDAESCVIDHNFETYTCMFDKILKNFSRETNQCPDVHILNLNIFTYLTICSNCAKTLFHEAEDNGHNAGSLFLNRYRGFLEEWRRNYCKDIANLNFSPMKLLVDADSIEHQETNGYISFKYYNYTTERGCGDRRNDIIGYHPRIAQKVASLERGASDRNDGSLNAKKMFVLENSPIITDLLNPLV